MASRAPFSRYPERSGGRGDGWDSARAAEYLAHAYGWDAQYLEQGATDEQVYLYLDAALERIGDEAHRLFHDAVEAVRLGTVTAHDKGALARWRSMSARIARAGEPMSASGHGLTGLALERALQAMLISNPDIVAVRVAGG